MSSATTTARAVGGLYFMNRNFTLLCKAVSRWLRSWVETRPYTEHNYIEHAQYLPSPFIHLPYTIDRRWTALHCFHYL